MKYFMLCALLGLSIPVSSIGSSLSVDVIEFENFGFSGTYSLVKKLSDIHSEDCTCEISSDPIAFSGPNSPINEEVSVHFRGPLILNKFAYYVSEDFEHGDDSSKDWSRSAYYDASSSTAENVTFLTKAGESSPCLGKGLTYADSDGLSSADEATVLAENTQINSNDEYVMFSNVSCGKSGYGKDCGVYRSDIPAYHGYYGTIKMFLFEFKMPEESTVDESISNYNMPAIWLLNAHIPRTSQYSDNVNCSCWRSGCGEFDIFEVMNSTEATHLYSTVHDYQGTDDIESGLQADGYILRDYDATMTGGVAFDKNGKAVIFISNSTSIDETISASDLNNWISGAGQSVTDKLASVSAASTSTSKSTSGGSILNESLFYKVLLGFFSILYYML